MFSMSSSYKTSFYWQRGQLRLRSYNQSDTIHRLASSSAVPAGLEKNKHTNNNKKNFICGNAALLDAAFMALQLYRRNRGVASNNRHLSSRGALYGYCCVSTQGTQLTVRAICRTAMWINTAGSTEDTLPSLLWPTLTSDTTIGLKCATLQSSNDAHFKSVLTVYKRQKYVLLRW